MLGMERKEWMYSKNDLERHDTAIFPHIVQEPGMRGKGNFG